MFFEKCCLLKLEPKLFLEATFGDVISRFQTRLPETPLRTKCPTMRMTPAKQAITTPIIRLEYLCDILTFANFISSQPMCTYPGMRSILSPRDRRKNTSWGTRNPSLNNGQILPLPNLTHYSMGRKP